MRGLILVALIRPYGSILLLNMVRAIIIIVTITVVILLFGPLSFNLGMQFTGNNLLVVALVL